MKKGTKEIHLAVLAAAISIFLAGCQGTEEQNAVTEPVGPAILTEAMKNDAENEKTEEVIETADEEEEPQPAIPEEEGFVLDSQDVFIPLADCVCEYESEDFQIYTKYFEDGNEYFPDAGTAVYMRTTGNEIQIFTSNEYCIDYENGVLYLVERDKHDDFISISRYCVVSIGERLEIRGSEILSLSSLEELFAELFSLTLSDTEINFWMDSVFVSTLDYEEENAVLKGEAYGVYNTAGGYYQGDYYHIDWEINTATGERKATPHVKRIYDEENDKEIFEACDKAFTEKDEGNWLELSDLNDWKSLVDWDSMEGWEANLWIRMDLNADNLPELIHLHGYKDWFELPIFAVYTYVGAVMKPLDRVYFDQNDSTEFLYLGSTGNMMYESCNGGMEITGWYAWKEFDEAWRTKTVLGLSFDYFTEHVSESEKEVLKEWYPDTYGSRGAGCYCYISRPKTTGENETELVKEEITLEEFLSEYEQITGFDYFEVNPYYEFIR